MYEYFTYLIFLASFDSFYLGCTFKCILIVKIGLLYEDHTNIVVFLDVSSNNTP
jgi:hypothetical protein